MRARARRLALAGLVAALAGGSAAALSACGKEIPDSVGGGAADADAGRAENDAGRAEKDAARDDDDDGRADNEKSGNTIDISVRDRELKPERVEIFSDRVQFEIENDGTRLHAFAIATRDGVRSTPELEPGQTATLTVTLTRGTYAMYDPRGGYRQRGVRGRIVVRDATADAGR